MAVPAKPSGITTVPSLSQVAVGWTGSSNTSILEYQYRLKRSAESLWPNPISISGATFNQIAGDGNDVRMILYPSNPNEDSVELVRSKNAIINVSSLETDLLAVVADKTKLKVLAGIETQLSSLATEATALVKVAGQGTDITAMVQQKTDILAVAGDASELKNLASFDTELLDLAGKQANLSAISLLKNAIVSVTNISATDIKALVDDKTDILAVANLKSDIAALTSKKTALVKVAGQGSDITALTNVKLNLLASAGSISGLKYNKSMTSSGTTPSGDGEYGFYTSTSALTSGGSIGVGQVPQRKDPGIKSSNLLVLSYDDKDGNDLSALIKSVVAGDIIRFWLSSSRYYILNVEAIYTRTNVKGFRYDLLDSVPRIVSPTWELGTQAITIDIDKAGGYNAQANLVKESTDLVSIAGDKGSIDALVQQKINLVALANDKNNIETVTAQWTLKTQVGDLVSGIGLYNDGSNSEFMVRADRFAVIPSTGSDSAKLSNRAVPFIVSGGKVYIDEAFIRNLTASKITSGTFSSARIPGLSATKITSGSLSSSRIPGLAASKITSGSLSSSRIPGLSATKITSGSFPTGRIPNLSANKITSDTLGDSRIPQLNILDKAVGNKIESVNANRWGFFWEDLGTPARYSSSKSYVAGDLVSLSPSGDSWDRLYVARRNTTNDLPSSNLADWSQILRWASGQVYNSSGYYRYYGYLDGRTNRIYKSKRGHTANEFSKPAQAQVGFVLHRDGTSYIKALEVDSLDLNTLNISGTLSADHISGDVKNVTVLYNGPLFITADNSTDADAVTILDDYDNYKYLMIYGIVTNTHTTTSDGGSLTVEHECNTEVSTLLISNEFRNSHANNWNTTVSGATVYKYAVLVASDDSSQRFRIRHLTGKKNKLVFDPSELGKFISINRILGLNYP